MITDPETPAIYSLSLHDALPIFRSAPPAAALPSHTAPSSVPSAGATPFAGAGVAVSAGPNAVSAGIDRKSTRLNSSHPTISYAVFCLKKKDNKINGESVGVLQSQ